MLQGRPADFPFIEVRHDRNLLRTRGVEGEQDFALGSRTPKPQLQASNITVIGLDVDSMG